MAVTRNGWAAAPPVRVPITAPGCADTGEVRAGDVATVLQHFTTEFDAQVEALTTINGYRTPAYNAQIGGDPASNHMSATAEDLNGARHPYERNLPASQRGANYRHGFTPAQVKAIRALLARYDGVIIWGLDFNAGWRDAMHFEIHGSLDDVARVADKLTGKTTAQEDDMDPEARNMIMHIGAFINEIPGRTAAAVAAIPVNRVPGQPSTWLQDSVDGTTAALAAVRILDPDGNGVVDSPVVDVDEAALASALAPLLATHAGQVVTGLSGDALAQVAEAVADEQARRQAS